MQMALKAGGQRRSVFSASARHAWAVVLLLAATVLASALLPMCAHADESYDNYSVLEPGVVMTNEGRVIFADILLDDKTEAVTAMTTQVGDSTTLQGGFHGGWGPVTLQWYSCDGDAVAVLQTEGADADASINWQLVSEATVNVDMPNMNTLVKAGGKSQTMAIQALNPGYSAWKLTATDSVGYSHSTWWVMTVNPASGNVTAPDGQNAGSSQTAGDNASQAQSNNTVQNTVVVEGHPANRFRPASGKGGMPQTGDAALRIAASVVAGIAAVAALAVLASWLLSRRKEGDTKDAL